MIKGNQNYKRSDHNIQFIPGNIFPDILFNLNEMRQGKEHVNISNEWQAFKWQGQYLNCVNIRPYSCLGKQNPKHQLELGVSFF